MFEHLQRRDIPVSYFQLNFLASLFCNAGLRMDLK